MDVSMSELRHRITFLRPVTDTDDEGNILAQTTQRDSIRQFGVWNLFFFAKNH